MVRTKAELVSVHLHDSSIHSYQTFRRSLLPEVDVLPASLAVLKVLLSEHVQLAVQPARLVPSNKTQTHFNETHQVIRDYTSAAVKQ